MNAIQTFAAINGRVLKSAGIISDVSVITEGEARGHDTYIDGMTLATVKNCLDAMPSGVKVKVNHFSGFDGIVGVLRDARISGDRVRADLHLLNEHPARDLIMELSERQPETFGLSIAFSGTKEKGKDGRRYARCSELYSCDLVDQPAANPTGLFSARVDSLHSTKELSMLDEIKQLLGFAQKADTTLEKLNAAAEKVIVLESAKSKLETDLAAATSRITALETRAIEATKLADNARAEADKAKADADKKAADAKAEADALAAKKAQQITAAQGQAPIGSGAPAAGTAASDIETQLNAITDPTKRTLFYREHEKEIKAARLAQRRAGN